MKGRETILAAILMTLCCSAMAAGKPLRIFLLLGQSNMEGQAYTYDSPATAGWNIPTMEFLLSGTTASTNYRASMPFDFEPSLDATWLDPRTDVWAVHYNSGNGNARDVQVTDSPQVRFNGIGPLSPGFGFGVNNGSMIGAELAMGVRLGDAMADPVFLFKSDLGGTTLGNDWRPPTAVAARGGTVGPNYVNSMNRFVTLLDALDADLLDDGVLNAYSNATAYTVSGVFWLQGWNEQYDDAPYTAAQLQAEYKDNLKDLIYSIRAEDPRIPGHLGLIIGESSDQNATLNASRSNAVAELNGEIPNSAALFDTAGMKGTDWGNNELGVPFSQGWGYHFHARAENFLEIGWKAGGAVLDNGFLSPSPLWFDIPVLSSVSPTQATATVRLGTNADEVVVVWDSSDQGTGATTDWANRLSLGSNTAGQVQGILAGLSEGSEYVVRFHATNSSLAAVAWSPSASFATPWQNPPPLLDAPAVSAITSEGATLACQLVQGTADVTVVWAHTDQGSSGIAAWINAAGGGSHALGTTAAVATVTHRLTGLIAATTYAFRFHATNLFGDAWTAADGFGTLSAGSGSGAASLVAYWNFDDYNETGDNPAGTPQGHHEGWFEDISDNGHSAYFADVSSGNFLPHDPSGGRFGGAFYSENHGNNGALGVVPHTDAINFNAEDFTFSFWEKSQFRDVAGRGWGAGRGRSQWFAKAPHISTAGVVDGFGLNLTQNHFDLLSNNNDNFGQTSLGARYTYPSGSSADDSGVWAHWAIVGVYNAVTNQYAITTYLNGTAVDWDGAVGTTVTVTNDIIDNPGVLTIGGFFRNNGWSPQRFISFNQNDGVTQTIGKGWMDDFAIWEAALDESDIADLASGTKGPLDISPPQGAGGMMIFVK